MKKKIKKVGYGICICRDRKKVRQQKKTNTACGDVVLVDRDQNSTIIIIADGMGSGVKASIYATMCVFGV